MRYETELKANSKRQEYMTKLETHFQQNQNDMEKLEKIITRVGEFIDKLKQDAPTKKPKEAAISVLKQKRETKLEDKQNKKQV
jgi:hypothetical protein